MQKYITTSQIKTILENAPEGVDKVQLLKKYNENGYTIEGYNDQPEEPATAPNMTGLEKAPFQATGEENIVGGTLKAIGNTPRSGFELGKNVLSAVTNPVQTVKSVAGIVKGAGAKLAETALEDTDLGQKLLQKMSDSRVSRGLQPLRVDEKGKLQGEDTQDLQTFNAVKTFVTDRYGSYDKLQETAIEDPVGVLADLATVLTGAGAAVSKVGTVSKASNITKAGGQITKLGQAVEPLNAVGKTVSGAKNIASTTTVGKIASDIIPTGTEMQRNQVIKALDLTQGDLVTISKKTGNDVTDFIVANKLIKDSPEAIASSLEDFRKTAKATKASEIAQVKSVYTPEQVPSVIKGLDTIYEDVSGVAGLEKVADDIQKLRTKKQFTLEDVQNAQYLLDENSSIYSKIGDAKSSTKAKGLDNIRKDIRSFIENEVDTATNGNTNIRKLNNDIQTSYSIEDAINTRATRNLTRQKISLSDSVVLFGGGATFSPVVGIGLYLGKKVIESPTFRLAFTKALSAQPIKRIKTIVNEIKNKNVSPETQKLLNQIADDVRKNKAVIESGSTILDKSKLEKEQ